MASFPQIDGSQILYFWPSVHCCCCSVAKLCLTLCDPMNCVACQASPSFTDPQSLLSNPLQYSCLENPMHRGAWWATVHGVTKSQTRLSDFSFTFTFMHWRRKWQPIPVFLPGESHGYRSLVGYSTWGHKELDMIKWLSMHPYFILLSLEHFWEWKGSNSDKPEYVFILFLNQRKEWVMS